MFSGQGGRGSMGALVDHRQPGPDPCTHPSQNVGDRWIPLAIKKACGDRCAIAGAADHGDRPVLGDFAVPLLEQAAMDVMGAVDMPATPFAISADIEHKRPLA